MAECVLEDQTQNIQNGSRGCQNPKGCWFYPLVGNSWMLFFFSPMAKEAEVGLLAELQHCTLKWGLVDWLFWKP